MMSRFCRYIDKVFAFGDWIGTLTDSRVKPQIPTGAIFASAFAMFATRRRSLNALEPDLRMPRRLEGLIGDRKPSADCIGAVFARMATAPVRDMLSHIHHRLKRNKVLASLWPMGFIALDGHEFFSQSTPLLRIVPHANRDGQRHAGHRVLPYGRGVHADQ
jgi:hypothetical protein